MASDTSLNGYTTQQNSLKSIIAKNKSIISGTGYSGTAPDYDALSVDLTDISNKAFASPDIYYPGANAGYKEVYDFMSGNNRFTQSVNYSRGDYYALEDKELDILLKYNSYHQQIITKLTTVPK